MTKPINSIEPGWVGKVYAVSVEHIPLHLMALPDLEVEFGDIEGETLQTIKIRVLMEDATTGFYSIECLTGAFDGTQMIVHENWLEANADGF